MVPHLEMVVPALIRELRCDESSTNRQNAAFAAGVLAEGCGPAMSLPMYQQLLSVGKADFKFMAPGNPA